MTFSELEVDMIYQALRVAASVYEQDAIEFEQEKRPRDAELSREFARCLVKLAEKIEHGESNK